MRINKRIFQIFLTVVGSIFVFISPALAADNNTPTPTISNVVVTTNGPQSLTVTWTTNVDSDTLVAWGEAGGYGLNNGAFDTNGGVTQHSETVTTPGIYPVRAYDILVRSRGMTNGQPDNTKVGYYEIPGETEMPGPSQNGNYDYYTWFVGTQHITQGYEGYIAVRTGILQGNLTPYVNYAISGLPPYSQIDCLDCGQHVQWMVTINGNSNTAQEWQPEDFEFGIVTNVGGTTPPGNYTVTINTSTGVNGQTGPNHQYTWPVTVVAPDNIVTSGPTNFPTVPDVSTWQSNMSYGQQWCDEGLDQGIGQNVWFYDGMRVYYQIADYTQNTSTWNPCAQFQANQYATYAINGGGVMQGYNVFTQGLYMDYLRTGDNPNDVQAVTNIYNNANYENFPNGWQDMYSQVRESSYVLNTKRDAVHLGFGDPSQVQRAVTVLLGILDQVTVSNTAQFNEPFMDGLASEALIHYYEDGHQSDVRIPIAIKQTADWLWANAWNQPGWEGNSFIYSTDIYALHIPPNPSSEYKTLNMLVAPLYAWLYKETGDTTYMTEGDAIWSNGVTVDAEGTLGYAGKQFSQYYRWSGEYINYRSGAYKNPPAAPTNLQATAISSSQISLTWTASTDQHGTVAGYNVYRDGIWVGTANALTYTDSGLQPDTQYTYTVTGYDALENNSALSSPASATTQSLSGGPTTPTNLQATAVSSSQINLTWTASTDNGGLIAGYKIFRDGTQVGTSTTTSYSDTGLMPSTQYTYTISAYDTLGRNSGQSLPASATTFSVSGGGPTTPTNLQATAVSGTQINLTWTASTDNGSLIAGYKVFRDGTQVGTSVKTSYLDTGLTPDTEYTYTVSAYDTQGRNSAQSLPASATTKGASVLGDVNGDGIVTAYDALLTAQYAAGLITLTPAQIQAADVSGNSTVTAYDAALIMQYSLGIINQFPVQQHGVSTGGKV